MGYDPILHARVPDCTHPDILHNPRGMYLLEMELAALGWLVVGWVALEKCPLQQTVWYVGQDPAQISKLPSES